MRSVAAVGLHTAAHVPPSGDVLAAVLAELEGNGKLVSAWFLPLADPDQYLTLDTTNVTTWAAAYGTQKVDLTEATNKPSWDATLFSNKGGVVFDGTNDLLTGTGNVTNWPGATDDLYMIVAARQDRASGTAGNNMALSYGANAVYRYVGRTTTNRARCAATASAISGATADAFTGAHGVAAHFDLGGTSRLYLDGVSEGTVASTTEALTLTRVRMGALSDNTPAGFWSGAIVAAAVLNSTASVSDFLQLESLMRARLI